MAMDTQSNRRDAHDDPGSGSAIPYFDLIHGETIRLIAAAVPRPGSWLDIGCGCGELVRRAQAVFPNTKYFISDASAENLAETRKKCGEHPGVTILGPSVTQEIALDVPLDVVTAIQCHHYLDKNGRIAAVQKCYELLKPGGIFVTSENVRPTSQRGVEIGLSVWKDCLVSCGRDEKSVADALGRFNVVDHPITVEDHFFLYRLCGFRIVEMFWYSCLQAGFYCVK